MKYYRFNTIFDQGENLMPICVYCNRDKPVEEFSDEHVLPQKIGGNLQPTNPFIIRNVCRRCNSISGLYIDGEFIRSWFTQNNRATFHLKYADIGKRPILPLSYMGISEELRHNGKLCEMWLGPTGDSIFHFHDPYPDEPSMPPMTGVPPSLEMRRIEYDRGFIFLFAVPTNPIWHPTVFYSVVQNFPGSTLYFGNGPTPRGGAFSNIPNELLNLQLKLKQAMKHEIPVQVVLGAHYGDRFLAKLGLGFGSLFLNESFVSSPEAQTLRNFMWQRDPSIRESIPLRGMPFLNERMGQDTIANYMKWSGGHFIYFGNNGNHIYLFVSIYESQNAGIVITENPDHWRGGLNQRENVYVVTPSLQKYVGPLSLGRYISHKQGLHPHTELEALEDEMTRCQKLPPRHTFKSKLNAKRKKIFRSLKNLFGFGKS
jgi:HNH endonuclease